MTKSVGSGMLGGAAALAAMIASGAVWAQEEQMVEVDGGGGDVIEVDGGGDGPSAVGSGGGSDFDSGGKGGFLGGTFSMNGFLRFESAFSTTSTKNPNNQGGDPANGVAIRRNAGIPGPGGFMTTLTPQALNDTIGQVNNLIGSLGLPGGLIGVPAPLNPPGVSNNQIVSDTVTRYVPQDEAQMNYHVIRFEATPTLSWGNEWSIISRIRALYDPGEFGYADYNARDYDGINGGISGGLGNLYKGKPNYFAYSVDGSKSPTPLEWSGRNYFLDFPALFAQYNSGNLTLRLGNQSIAWGQLLFFRVMDTANGLDLRRHLILDRALEEYADERQSALGLRATYQLSDRVVGDAFVQQFRPSNLPNPNTPYNVIPAQFTIHDRYSAEDYDKKVNYGIRFKGDFGDYTAQAMYTRRYNQLGAFRWTKSGVNKPLPNDNALGLVLNRYCEAVLGSAVGQGCGPQLANTAFEASPAGVFTAEEWFNYASGVRLDPVVAYNRAVDEFPAAQSILAVPVGDAITPESINAVNNALDTFFMAGNGLHGHLDRRYFAEDIFGLGGGIVTSAEPGSIFDQIIINLEATYTPNRTFTAIDLRQDYDKREEVQIGLVAEKYQRFSPSFPATYMVFQYLWQKNSDLFGFLLDGYGSENFSDQGVVLNSSVPTSSNPKITPGISAGANYVVLAALQPFPNYIWELSAAFLIDVQGGILAQPGVQWKPRGDITVNLFYNYTNGDAWGGNSSKNLMRTIEFADEVGMRFQYQF